MPDDREFEIQGPDDQGEVWIVATPGADAWRKRLGKVDDVAESMSQWLASVEMRDPD